MGCSASKHHGEQENVPLTRSMSLPGTSPKVEGGIRCQGSSNSANRGNGMGNSDLFCTGDSVAAQRTWSCSMLKPVQEEDLPAFVSMDTISQRRRHVRTASFGSVSGENFEMRSSFLVRDAGFESGCQRSKPVDNLSGRADSRASSFRVMESIDGDSGLRILLSPACTASRSFTSSQRSGTFCKTLSSSGRLALCHRSNSSRMSVLQAAQNCKVVPVQLEGMGDSEESGTSLFDPSLLAKFEKAVETSSDASDFSSSSSSRVKCWPSDTCTDAESVDWQKESGICQGVQVPSWTMWSTEDKPCKVTGDTFQYRSSCVLKKKSSSSKVTPLLNDAWVKKCYLEAFDLKCPPGCEGKTVLYFTSLRGIRKTYEDCCTVRLILKGFGVQVDERDVWMHSTFLKELTNVVGAVLTVPRLFIKGRYIGGVEDVKHLHEEGVLGNLLEGLPADLNRVCDMCGGVRFVPCISCNGSCKLVSHCEEVLRCPDCNENGLMMCPSCSW